MHASISRFGHLAFEETVLMAKTNHFSSIAIMLTDQHKNSQTGLKHYPTHKIGHPTPRYQFHCLRKNND